MRRTFACGLFVILAISLPAAGQAWIDFEFGVRAGVPFTDYNSFRSASGSPIHALGQHERRT